MVHTEGRVHTREELQRGWVGELKKAGGTMTTRPREREAANFITVGAANFAEQSLLARRRRLRIALMT